MQHDADEHDDAPSHDAGSHDARDDGPEYGIRALQEKWLPIWDELNPLESSLFASTPSVVTTSTALTASTVRSASSKWAVPSVLVAIVPTGSA